MAILYHNFVSMATSGPNGSLWLWTDTNCPLYNTHGSREESIFSIDPINMLLIQNLVYKLFPSSYMYSMSIVWISLGKHFEFYFPGRKRIAFSLVHYTFCIILFVIIIEKQYIYIYRYICHNSSVLILNLRNTLLNVQNQSSMA